MSFFRFLVEDGSRMDLDLSNLTPSGRPRPFQKRSKNASATQPRFLIDFGNRFGDISMIVVHFLLILSVGVASFCELLALKCLASTASFPRCRRSLCVYTRPLGWHFRPKKLQKGYPAIGTSASGVDLGTKWRRKRPKTTQGSNFIHFGNILAQFGIDVSWFSHDL